MIRIVCGERLRLTLIPRVVTACPGGPNRRSVNWSSTHLPGTILWMLACELHPGDPRHPEMVVAQSGSWSNLSTA